jgi:hypothetical protein
MDRHEMSATLINANATSTNATNATLTMLDF